MHIALVPSGMYGTETESPRESRRLARVSGMYSLMFLFWFGSPLGTLILCKAQGMLQGMGCGPDHPGLG